MRYAILNSRGVCINLIEAEPEFASSIQAVEAPPEVYLGDSFEDGEWKLVRQEELNPSPPPVEKDPYAEMAKAIRKGVNEV